MYPPELVLSMTFYPLPPLLFSFPVTQKLNLCTISRATHPRRVSETPSSQLEKQPVLVIVEPNVT